MTVKIHMAVNFLHSCKSGTSVLYQKKTQKSDQTVKRTFSKEHKCAQSTSWFFCFLDLYILCVFNQNCGMMVMTRVTQNV